ncbi:imidazole glycerol phosphate synthase subunit HisH [Leucobacter tardus]|uniref:Imidazole glycerol phosphate synthase subunit HisH n=1 Tax=Leucobacter tardus TaxID=501483 RepID=A0A939TV56_9MICO|nr:imidazole glycerol phosphate synthase subunit HisH [Leucobacter tardus]MBO2990450.1 imidazole glycerol phosphate synthase subunit HisH [Leucobacter tardus]
MTDTLPDVAVLDYGSGNVHSAVKALARAGARVDLTRDPDAVRSADGLLVPGVGAFDAVIRALRAVGGDRLIAERLAAGKPVLGICVGEQVMFARGIERGVETEGLGYWPGTVRELRAPVLPHMGWSTVEAPAESRLFRGIAQERFYFVHSNAAPEWAVEADASGGPEVTWAEHGERFVAAVEDGPLTATQFHPEKSGEAGIRLLGNWIASLRTTPAESE